MVPITFAGGIDELCHTLILTPVGGMIAALTDAGRDDLFNALVTEVGPFMTDGEIRSETVSHIAFG